MKVLDRICIEDFEIVDGDKHLLLKRGQEYTTSPERNGCVTVFSTFWASGVPVSIFAGEIELGQKTKDMKSGAKRGIV